MKYFLLLLLPAFPLLLPAQKMDTLTIKKSLDSLTRVLAAQSVKRDYPAMKTSAAGIVALAERLHGRKNGQVAFGLNSLAVAEMNIGNLEAAIVAAEEVLAIRSALYQRKDPLVGWALNTLGLLYFRAGRIKEAEACFVEFKNSITERLGPNHPDVGFALMHLSNFYQYSGRYKEAEEGLLELKDLWSRVYGKASVQYGMVLNNQALFVNSMGRSSEAEQYLLEAKSIFEGLTSQDSMNYAFNLSNLGIIYFDLGRYSQAIPFYEKAIACWEQMREGHKMACATTLNGLSLAYFKSGNPKKAEEYLFESLKRTEKAPDRTAGSYAVRLHNLADLYKTTGREQAADSLLQIVKSIFAKVSGRNTREYISILINQATLYQMMGRYAECDQLLLEVRELDNELFQKVTRFLSEEELNQYSAQLSGHFSQPFSIAVQRKNVSAELSTLCFNTALVSKGFIEESVATLRRQVYGDSLSARQFQAIGDLRRKLAQEYAREPAARDSAFIRYAVPRANDLEKDLSRKFGDPFAAGRIIHSEDVRKSLHPGEAAVEFVAFYEYNTLGSRAVAYRYAALVLLPDDPTPHFIPLFDAQQLNELFNRPGFDEQLTVKSLYGSRSKLRELLWEPLEPLLKDVKTIYYSPAGMLHGINPAALLDADKQPLSAGRQWVRLGSTRELAARRLADRSFAHDAAAATAELWGGIHYDMDSLAFSAANPADLAHLQPKEDKYGYLVENARGDDGGAWKDLEGSGPEVKRVNELLQNAGFSTALRSGYEAGEEQFKAMGQNRPSPRILHIATHGFAYPDPRQAPAQGASGPVYKQQDDPMLRSGLLLAGANHYWLQHRPLQGREDGVLVAYEVRDLRLENTELAVLSACQTGLGDVVGSEGVYGLQRAFRIAGAKFLIVSLWHVPDTQTRQLMDFFYENWTVKKESLRDAFNHAQAALREQEPNPYMWAGFVLIE